MRAVLQDASLAWRSGAPLQGRLLLRGLSQGRAVTVPGALPRHSLLLATLRDLWEATEGTGDVVLTHTAVVEQHGVIADWLGS